MSGHQLNRFGSLTFFLIGLLVCSASIVSAVPPSNDDFNAATVISGVPYNLVISDGRLSEATAAADDPTDCAATEQTVWYRFTPTTNLAVRFEFGSEGVPASRNTPGALWSHAVGVYTGTRGALTQVGCQIAYNYQFEHFDLNLRANTTYYILLSSYYDARIVQFLFRMYPVPTHTLTGFTLVNAAADTDIMPLPDGDSIAYPSLPTRRFNIRADANSGVRSVRFILTRYDDYPSNTFERTTLENVRPFALAGDVNGNYNDMTLTPDTSYRLTAIPYSGANGTGAQGTRLQISFYVSGYTAVNALFLLNADTNQDIRQLWGMNEVIDLAALPTRNLNVRAETQPAVVGSVRFGFNSNPWFRVENAAPYALAGDVNGDFNGMTFAPGTYTITATAFSEQGSQGLNWQPYSVTFRFTDSRTPFVTEGVIGDGGIAPLTFPAPSVEGQAPVETPAEEAKP